MMYVVEINNEIVGDFDTLEEAMKYANRMRFLGEEHIFVGEKVETIKWIKVL